MLAKVGFSLKPPWAFTKEGSSLCTRGETQAQRPVDCLCCSAMHVGTLEFLSVWIAKCLNTRFAQK